MTLPIIGADQLPRQAYGHDKNHDPALTLPEKFRPPHNDRYMPKPQAGGLWTSTVTEVDHTGKITCTTWLEWCRSEGWGEGRYTHFLEITPDPRAKMLRIDTLADLRTVHAEYGFLPDDRFPAFAAVLDWERMALDGLDAVYLTGRGQAQTRFPHDGGPSLYGWDCESTVWLRPSYTVGARVLTDKRDECGCHRGCTVLPHDCEKPCNWPGCLTPEESAKLAEDVAKDLW